MQRMLAWTLLATLPFAGCLGAADTETTPAAAETPDVVEAPVVPETIEDSKSVAGSADPLNVASNAICTTPSAQCFRYPFTLENTTAVAASLTWGVPASDFDLYIRPGGETETSGQAPPGTSEAISTTLEAGDYEVIVVAWAVAQDTYNLKVEFTAVAPAAES